MIVFCCVVVILGAKKPFTVLLTSSMALVSGKLPVELMAMFCENAVAAIVTCAMDNKSFNLAFIGWFGFVL